MTKAWMAAVTLLVATGALAQGEVLKTFTDKGSVYLRSPATALAVGTELVMVNDAKGSKAIGKGVVIEVNGVLVRLALDDEATTAKAKFAKLPTAPAAAAAPVAPPAAPADKPVAAAPKPPAAPTPPPPPPAVSTLKGRIENLVVRVRVFNESDTPWSDCELRYSDERWYKMGNLAANSDDGVLTVKFTGPPAPLYDHVLVRCDEGETKFVFANPQSPGKLKGYVENAGGRVVVHNTSEVTWNRCDVKKPDGQHYVMNSLRAKDRETISSVNFKKEPQPGPTSLTLTCKEGQLVLPL